MEKLELKHLAPYLPYSLMVKHKDESYNFGVPVNLGLKIYSLPTALLTNFKPILRPLSDLDKEIKYNDKTMNYYEYLVEVIDGWCDAYDEWWDFQYPSFSNMVKNCPYEIFEKLIELHFDVFELIPKGLAVDINTLK